MEAVFGTEEDDILSAFELGGEILGLGGDDIIFAGEGQDIVDGGIGNDLILGASDGDILLGGEGTDTFVIELEAEGGFEIKDFEAGIDKLDLTAFEGLSYGDLHFEPFDYGEILILDDQEIVFTNITKGTLPTDIIFADDVIDFEAPQPGGHYLQDGYKGFDWEGFYRIDANIDPWGASQNVHATSGDHVAHLQDTDAFGNPVTIAVSREEPFTVHSLQLGSASTIGAVATFTAFRDGQIVGQKTHLAHIYGTEHVAFSSFAFGEIDRMEITMDGGTPAPNTPYAYDTSLYVDDMILL